MRATFGISILLVLATMGCRSHSSMPAQTDVYLYEDTRQLVNFVDAAAALIERRGTGAFRHFDHADSVWRTSSTYLFVYDTEGVCVWHGMNPELVGRNLISFRDALGKPVVQTIADVGRRPEPNASEWIFYLWEEQTDFNPIWKNTYVRKAVTPDGKVYIVGSGSSRLKVEKVFAQSEVDAAAQLLQEQGVAVAFSQLRDPGSRFDYLGNFVFVLDGSGKSLVDPSYPTLQGRDMSGFRDAVGRPIVQDLLRKLQNSDSAWVQFLWPKPGERLPSRKLMYARKVNIDGQTLIVGSDFFLATPIWMRL